MNTRGGGVTSSNVIHTHQAQPFKIQKPYIDFCSTALEAHENMRDFRGFSTCGTGSADCNQHFLREGVFSNIWIYFIQHMRN